MHVLSNRGRFGQSEEEGRSQGILIPVLSGGVGLHTCWLKEQPPVQQVHGGPTGELSVGGPQEEEGELGS